jgi:6-oxo-cyclohex-1-ene-carbonyl-CoA hydrolase
MEKCIMGLDWLPRDNKVKNHALHADIHWSKEAPGVIYDKRPLADPQGKPIDNLFTSWIVLNNPQQFNSYTTEMVKGVIAGFENASLDRTVVAVVFTGQGTNAFCTGGNTKEYAEYYSKRPNEYGEYMELFNHMVDSILMCKKPVICRVNGMRVAGGQEIGMACDIAIASDLAIFGQAGPRHGSSPDGGSSDFLPWYLSIEDALWNCVSCEMWSAYKMKRLGLINKAIPVINDGGSWVRNPSVITDRYVDDGEIVYGESKTGEDLEKANAYIKGAREQNKISLDLVDKEIDKIVWLLTNLFPGCALKAMDSVRAKKKFFWDQAKNYNRHWLAANMNYEAFPGFQAYNTRRTTGKGTIDFIKFRQLIAQGKLAEDEMYDAVMPKPKSQPPK